MNHVPIEKKKHLKSLVKLGIHERSVVKGWGLNSGRNEFTWNGNDSDEI